MREKNGLLTKRLLSLFFLFLAFQAFGLYPQIERLHRHDPLFSQLQEDIAGFYRIASSGKAGKLPALKLFSYSPRKGEDLLACSARLNISYDTLASLNGFENSGDFKSRKEILIPSQPGLFIPETPLTDLEEIMALGRPFEAAQKLTIIIEEKRRIFYFFPGEKFAALERAFFLRILFRFPLTRNHRISSGYGKRPDPFTGHQDFHNGIDIGAPTGTDVLAARDGTVTSVGYSPVYGNYIFLSHAGGYETLYGHLSKTGVKTGDPVRTGMIIGLVGNTGRSTGPHLHFEIRKKGDTKDPLGMTF